MSSRSALNCVSGMTWGWARKVAEFPKVNKDKNLYRLYYCCNDLRIVLKSGSSSLCLVLWMSWSFLQLIELSLSVCIFLVIQQIFLHLQTMSISSMRNVYLVWLDELFFSQVHRFYNKAQIFIVSFFSQLHSWLWNFWLSFQHPKEKRIIS